ncbi:MAG: glutamine synthetase [Lachnospiraceae bacterium]|nr:glutamine synthetase [Lachnospiraceae bacterium]
MSRYTREDILRMVEEEDVGFVRLQFTDVFGTMKNVAITAGQMERALDNCCSFDGSGIDGFVRIEEEDMYLYPDLDTFQIMPWRPQTGKVARLICDIRTQKGEPFAGDCRYVLKKVIREAAQMGYFLYVAPECEFCVFPCDSDGEVVMETKSNASYFDVAPLDQGENVRRDIILTLEDMGIDVKSSFHEHSPYQHEIDLLPVHSMLAADNITTFRMVTRTIAMRHGLHATFMPKPKNGSEGCGMHLKMELHDMEGNNVFADPADPYGLSETGYSFMAGVMEHIRGLTAITNPLINSYRRICPGNAAPSYISWSRGNRSPLISVPATTPENAHIELRNPDPALNPYLAIAGILAAGLDGIRRGLKPGPATEKNLHVLERTEVEKLGLKRLPMSLSEAVGELEKDELLLSVLGEHISGKYIRSKRREIDKYLSYVTDWEVNQYLHKY